MAPQREWFEKDYYAVLGVEPGASDRDIQRAYRKLAKANHPDANAGDQAAEDDGRDREDDPPVDVCAGCRIEPHQTMFVVGDEDTAIFVDF